MHMSEGGKGGLLMAGALRHCHSLSFHNRMEAKDSICTLDVSLEEVERSYTRADVRNADDVVCVEGKR